MCTAVLKHQYLKCKQVYIVTASLSVSPGLRLSLYCPEHLGNQAHPVEEEECANCLQSNSIIVCLLHAVGYLHL